MDKKNLPNILHRDVSLKDLLDLHKQDIFLSLNCHAIATIKSFDATNQSVRASINYLKSNVRADQQTGIYGIINEAYPLLIDCPAIIMQGGGAALTFPIEAGDTCLILFNDRDMDTWASSGQLQETNTARLHSFSDAIALVGLRSFNNPLPAYDQTRAVLKYNNAMVGVGFQDKVKVANTSASLNDLLQQLVSNVNDLVTATANLTVLCAGAGNPSSVPINQVNIIAVATELSATATAIGELLE